MMTVNELYRKSVVLLENAGIEDAEFDARCLLEYALNVDTTQYFMLRSENINSHISEHYNELIKNRISGIPLQYLLGKWEFMGNEFYVGDGVLIPRPETEQLVELACEFLKDKEDPVVVDMCSGSGCIAVSVAKSFKNSKVFAVEKYDKAFSYLKKNIEHNHADNVIPIKGDLFDKNVLSGILPDLIVSNPPYIRKDDLKFLQTEVLHEPVTAFDGGNDGYDFYRFLCGYWFGEYLPENSAMMLECAEDQGDYILSMFSRFTDDSSIHYDFNNLQRIVTAFK